MYRYSKAEYYDSIRPYLEGKILSCSYCDHLSRLILLEGKHTYITLAIGQMTEGYLQICANQHRTGITGLRKEEAKELVLMKEIVRGAYKLAYGTPGIAFEHGKAGACHWGDTISAKMNDLCHHAHIHYVPIEVDIRPQIEAVLGAGIVVGSVWEMRSLPGVQKGNPYLYFEDNECVGYVYPVADERRIPRQFLRKCVAEAMGAGDRWDWKKYPGIELFSAGREKLQEILIRLLVTI